MSDEAGKTFTQEELNEIVKERVKRERDKFADYETLKQLVAKADAEKEASQTEIEKLTKAVDALTANAEKSAREQLIARVARDHKITDQDDINLFLTGADEDTLVAQAKRLQATTEAAIANGRRGSTVVPTEGNPVTKTPGQPGEVQVGELRELAHTLFGAEATG